jgi:hypothetical protein
MQIVFSNNEILELVLDTTPITTVYKQIYKHLRHVPIPFRDWDNPFYSDNLDHCDLVKRLIIHAGKVHVQIDQERCLAQDQNYLNYIHEIYEKNYNGNPAWLNFHEHIHLCERQYGQISKILRIDYREKSGMLEKPFDYKWLKNATTKIKAGDVFVNWAELGKTPYRYWKNREPNDMNRMQELIKPWISLKPKILIALEDIDTLKNIEIEEFESWWMQHSKALCQYWNIPSWEINDIFSVTVFGQVPNLEAMILQLKNNQKPLKVLL